MIINKITTGFVVQKFDTETRKFISQEFIAGDETEWETVSGRPVGHDADLIYGKGGVDEPYLNFEMIQP
jgi:hypothetical protein